VLVKGVWGGSQGVGRAHGGGGDSDDLSVDARQRRGVGAS
jgi:hypothetical protein